MAACQDVKPALVLHGLSPEHVSLDVSDLGFKSGKKLTAYVNSLQHHRHMIAPHCLNHGCHIVELTLYVKNKSNQAVPPPVVRVKTPANWPTRLPIAYQKPEIQPLETAKLKWLLSRAPEERSPEIRLSTSVLVDIQTSTQEGNNEK